MNSPDNPIYCTLCSRHIPRKIEEFSKQKNPRPIGIQTAASSVVAPWLYTLGYDDLHSHNTKFLLYKLHVEKAEFKSQKAQTKNILSGFHFVTEECLN